MFFSLLLQAVLLAGLACQAPTPTPTATPLRAATPTLPPSPTPTATTMPTVTPMTTLPAEGERVGWPEPARSGGWPPPRDGYFWVWVEILQAVPGSSTVRVQSLGSAAGRVYWVDFVESHKAGSWLGLFAETPYPGCSRFALWVGPDLQIGVQGNTFTKASLTLLVDRDLFVVAYFVPAIGGDCTLVPPLPTPAGPQ